MLKLEAFNDRGGDDCLSSRDFEDIVLLIDAREELVTELVSLSPEAAGYACAELARAKQLPTFTYGFEGAIGGPDSRARMDVVTLPRVEWMIEALRRATIS